MDLSFKSEKIKLMIKAQNYLLFLSIMDKKLQIIQTQLKRFFVLNRSLPLKFYLMFKAYLNESSLESDGFLLFNAWNNYKDNFYIKPNNEYGFSYLNYFSKALFNLENEFKYNFFNLRNKCTIAVQIHLFYEDLIEEVINKTNNIPIKFDLFINIKVIPKNINYFI